MLTETLDEFIDTLLVFQTLAPQPAHPTKRVVAVRQRRRRERACDRLFRALRAWTSTPFGADTVALLAALKLPPGTSITNPVDCPVGTLQQDDGRVAEKILDIIYASGKPEALVMHLNMSAFVGRTKPEVLDNLVQAALRVQTHYPGQAHFVLVLRSDGEPAARGAQARFSRQRRCARHPGIR